MRLGARCVEGCSAAEEALARDLPHVSDDALAFVRKRLAAGDDPLGDTFCVLRSATDRRVQGVVYTPLPIVDAMVTWAAGLASPARIVDAGAGSARFLVRAGRRFLTAQLWGIELDPLAALLARAHLAAAGLASRSKIIVADYREAISAS